MSIEILEKIESFPVLDDTVTKVVDICEDENASLMDLSKVIQSDPLTSANILKAANNPIYDFDREIKNISQAVSLFGMESIKSFALATFVQKMSDIDLSPYFIDAKTFIDISQRQNAFVANWFKGDKKSLDALMLPSYVLEIGKIIFSKAVIDTSSQIIFSAQIYGASKQSELTTIEEDIFEFNNESITALLLKKWGFPSSVYDIIHYMHNPQEAPSEIIKYSQILQIVKTVINTQGFDQRSSLEEALALVDKYELNQEKFIEVYKKQIKVKSAVCA
jgi:HD-like signal output (HDOD) protein